MPSTRVVQDIESLYASIWQPCLGSAGWMVAHPSVRIAVCVCVCVLSHAKMLLVLHAQPISVRSWPAKTFRRVSRRSCVTQKPLRLCVPLCLSLSHTSRPEIPPVRFNWSCLSLRASLWACMAGTHSHSAHIPRFTSYIYHDTTTHTCRAVCVRGVIIGDGVALSRHCTVVVVWRRCHRAHRIAERRHRHCRRCCSSNKRRVLCLSYHFYAIFVSSKLGRLKRRDAHTTGFPRNRAPWRSFF